ncbi:uncharacterized protein VTP21DRAFT_7363 [Calcarisporiella thermophila]|uniref:uncharacterized protein n=1 Tax=Calcarisporiella thermophila TaxID=911321 RepID=UPI0037432792
MQATAFVIDEASGIRICKSPSENKVTEAIMSTRAKLTFVGATLITGGIVWSVHHQQEVERENMHKGILRDEERRARKLQQEQNRLDLAVQKALQEKLEKLDPVDHKSSD